VIKLDETCVSNGIGKVSAHHSVVHRPPECIDDRECRSAVLVAQGSSSSPMSLTSLALCILSFIRKKTNPYIMSFTGNVHLVTGRQTNLYTSSPNFQSWLQLE